MPDDHVTLARPEENRIAQAEWDVRVKLAAAYRLVDHYGWTETDLRSSDSACSRPR